jgi:hypothetical protein
MAMVSHRMKSVDGWLLDHEMRLMARHAHRYDSEMVPECRAGEVWDLIVARWHDALSLPARRTVAVVFGGRKSVADRIIAKSVPRQAGLLQSRGFQEWVQLSSSEMDRCVQTAAGGREDLEWEWLLWSGVWCLMYTKADKIRPRITIVVWLCHQARLGYGLG